MFILLVTVMGSALLWFGSNIIYLGITERDDDIIDYIKEKISRRKEVKKVEEPKWFPRPTPLNMFDEKVFNDWLEAKDNRTLDDFCLYETETENRARKQLEYYVWEMNALKNTYDNKKSNNGLISGSIPNPKYFLTESVEYRPNDFYPPVLRQREAQLDSFYDLFNEPYKSIAEELDAVGKKLNKYGRSVEEVDAAIDAIIKEIEEL